MAGMDGKSLEDGQSSDVLDDLRKVLVLICVDWRNPGSLDDPADLIADGLLQASSAMVGLLSRYAGLATIR